MADLTQTLLHALHSSLLSIAIYYLQARCQQENLVIPFSIIFCPETKDWIEKFCWWHSVTVARACCHCTWHCLQCLAVPITPVVKASAWEDAATSTNGDSALAELSTWSSPASGTSETEETHGPLKDLTRLIATSTLGLKQVYNRNLLLLLERHRQAVPHLYAVLGFLKSTPQSNCFNLTVVLILPIQNAKTKVPHLTAWIPRKSNDIPLSH